MIWQTGDILQRVSFILRVVDGKIVSEMHREGEKFIEHLSKEP